MAIEAKADFLNQMETRLADVLTAADLSRTLAAVSEILGGFRITAEEKEADTGWDDLMQAYTDALKVQGRSQKTIDRYVYIIGRMMNFVKVPVCRITVYHLRAYLSAEKERGIAEQTLEGYREIFSAYFNWLQREDLIQKNPTANLGAIKVPKVTRKTYSDVDLEKLNRECGNVRNRAIIHFLGSTGCRISEMTGLDRNAVDLNKLECIVHGKGNKERVVYLDEVAGMLLGQYLDERTDSSTALFVGKGGRRLQPGGVRAMLNRIAKAAGVEHVHPHRFRRTLATNMARHGMPIQEVAAILGHEKLDTTMKYVVLNRDDIRSSYRRFA